MSELQPNQSPNFRRFADWCLHKDSLSPEARHTVDLLLEKVITSDCYQAEQQLASLIRLRLYNEEISDLSPLSTLTNLAYLELTRNNICDISPLSTLSNLRHLALSHNQIADFSPLSKLTNLTKLFVWRNKINVDLSQFSSLVNLTLLDVSSNQISSLSPLSNLINLTQLFLNYNREPEDQISDLISDLSPLSGLQNLTVLHLGDNQISDLSTLSKLINLKELSLGKNLIYDVSHVANLTNLTELHIDDNLISDLSHLFKLTNLISLNIGKNQIRDLNTLSRLDNLIKLSIGDNQISDLSPLSKLINLRELHLGENNISDISPLFELANLTKFTTDATRQIIDNTYLSSIWKQYYFYFTVPIDKEKATSAIKSTYAVLGLQEPEVIFYPDPYIIRNKLDEFNSNKQPLWGKPLAYEIYKFCESIGNRLSSGLKDFLYSEIANQLPLLQEFNTDFDPKWESDYITPSQMLIMISRGQILMSKFNYVLDDKEKEAWQCLNQLFENCGWIFPGEKVCALCDRPRKISLDTDNRLHAEGEPAIEFADSGHPGYYYHGVKLPEKYGKLHPQQWEAQWLLEEDNAELRRILIQGIGYDRICEQLQAQVIDFWQEYTLLRIDADVDVEPIHLLKMTCPSTAKIHTLRVPPLINSARVAIRWVNWDIDPEEFSVQT
ncbi:leucine-rich repeat domain-containing protein [Calothrix sp. FACHB-1219]|uniref:leucine-rich repeat domain-containing protein n=1 Tax=unclassified Calothrix TaxID=2619626 RepID=UPI001682D6D7|nr:MULTISPECIES: leucine-rich repeat domain-containing protein [unclassified Calothrix]MBD2203419.1 leucine-rich repeat domain-containing protein [Calothrix sp. FACHB-168]MBD2219011.1 leucine-rich repeat domain-containing protein [Calothrix sp. FACHB-1219]